MNRLHSDRAFRRFFWFAVCILLPGAVDSSAAVPQIATLTAPANGATRVSAPYVFQWISAPGAQDYHLWVGTSPGAHDVVYIGGATLTSYTARSLPYGQTLYATLWTKLAGAWYSSSSTFTTSQLIARLTAPANGATQVSAPCLFQWTSVAGAQNYSLYVGTSPGAHDVVYVGGATLASYTAASLPYVQTLYATLWTELGGAWYSSTSTFTTSPQIASLTAPANGATKVSAPYVFQWTSAPGAQDYHLWVGTSPGAHDVVYIGGATLTSYTAASLPYGQILYATLWTKLGGVWYPSRSTFTTSPPIAKLTTPVNGSVGVDPDCVFRWTSVPDAQGYYLYVGTTPGAKDVINTGALPITSTSYPSIALPPGQTFYVTILTELGGVWYPSGTTFSTSLMPPGASSVPNAASTMIFPAHGAMDLDIDQPFQWTYADFTGEYWLIVGTTHGGCDVSNSGPIYAPRRFISGLPLGSQLYGQLFVKTGGIWALADDFTFSARSNQTTTNAGIQSACWATDYVRHMADYHNAPVAGTLLVNYAIHHITNGVHIASCGEYAQTLMTVLDGMALPLDTALLRIVFNTNVRNCDGHVLVEMFNPDQQSWMVLDPTFSLSARRASDGAWATAEDIRASALNQTWNQINYVFLGAEGDVYARNYFLDYPLLFLNVYHGSTPIVPDQGPSILPYFTRLSLPATGYGVYAMRSTTQPAITFVDTVNGGRLYSVDCDGIDSFSHCFVVWSVAVPEGGNSFELYTPNRYVF